MAVTTRSLNGGRWVAKLSAIAMAAGLAVGVFSGTASAANGNYEGTFSPQSACIARGNYLLQIHYIKSYECDRTDPFVYELWVTYTPR
jgi:hypothetical protein